MRQSIPVNAKQFARVGELEAQVAQAQAVLQEASTQLVRYLEGVADGAGLAKGDYVGRESTDGVTAVVFEVPESTRADSVREPARKTRTAPRRRR